MTQKVIERKQVSHTIFNIIGNFCYAVCTWLLSWILTKMSGEGMYGNAGILALAISIGNVFIVIANYGIRPYQVSDILNKYSDEEYIMVRWITVLISLLGCLITSWYLNYSRIQMLSINIFMLYQASYALSDVMFGILQKRGRLDLVGKSMMIRGISMVVSFSIGFFLSSSILLALLLLAGSGFLVTVAFDFRHVKNFYVGKKLCRKISGKKIKELLVTGTPMCIYAIINPFVLSFPRIILEKYAGEDVLGIFSLVFAPTIVISVFANGILMAILPIQAQSYIEKKTKLLLFWGVAPLAVIAFVGTAATLVAKFLGGWILGFLYDSTIAQYIDLFVIAIVVSTLSALLSGISGILTSIRKIKYLLTFNVFGGILVMILSLYWIPKDGAWGAGIAMITGMFVQFIVSLGYLSVFFLKLDKSVRMCNI